MKNFFFATATAIALFAAPAFAGATQDITGCATEAAQGSNFTVRVDPNCQLSNDQPDGDNALGVLGAKALVALLDEDK